MHWYYGSGTGWAGFLIMGTMMVVLWGGLAALVVVLIRGQQRTTGPAPAIHILEERLAKGEIDTDEFERVRRTLKTG
jgi:putative membrane protein